MKVLAFGEILWDVINGVEHLGGAPFNFAAHMAQCGHETFMVSRLGMDELGDRAFRKASEHKVRTDFIQRDKKYPTGVVDVTLANGQPDYFIPGQSEGVHERSAEGVASANGISHLHTRPWYLCECILVNETSFLRCGDNDEFDI